MARVRSIVLVVALVAPALALASVASSAPAFDVCPVGCPYASLQLAVEEAPAGATLTVGPGTYRGSVWIFKPLTLLGPQAGVLAKGRTGPEAIVDPNGGSGFTSSHSFLVGSDHVTIDGFTASTDSPFGNNEGILVWAFGGDDRRILNNVITGFTMGMLAGGNDGTTVEGNWFVDNNAPPWREGEPWYPWATSGVGIRGGTHSSFVVRNNDFDDHANWSILADRVSDRFVIENNRFVRTPGVKIGEGGATWGLVASNGFDRVPGDALVIHENQYGLRIEDNAFRAIGGDAIRFSRSPYGPGSPSDSTRVAWNRFDHVAGYAVAVDEGAHRGAVDARHNWWDGPLEPAAEGERNAPLGARVRGDVDTAEACLDASCLVERAVLRDTHEHPSGWRSVWDAQPLVLATGEHRDEEGRVGALNLEFAACAGEVDVSVREIGADGKIRYAWLPGTLAIEDGYCLTRETLAAWTLDAPGLHLEGRGVAARGTASGAAVGTFEERAVELVYATV